MDYMTSFAIFLLFAIPALILSTYMFFNIPKKYQTMGRLLRAPLFWVAFALFVLAFIFGISQL